MARLIRTVSDIEGIARLEERLRVATLTHQCAELERLLRSEFTSATAGKLTYKKDLIRAHSLGTLRFTRLEVLGAVDVMPSGFVMHASFRTVVAGYDDWRRCDGVFRHHRVWVRGEAGWQAIRASVEPEPS